MAIKRVPIADIIAKSNQGDEKSKGIKCPRCQCIQFSNGKNVRDTDPIDGGIKRYRVCRNCGHTFRTIER